MWSRNNSQQFWSWKRKVSVDQPTWIILKKPVFRPIGRGEYWCLLWKGRFWGWGLKKNTGGKSWHRARIFVLCDITSIGPNMRRCLREFRVCPPQRLFTGGKSGRVAGELPWGRVEPSWRRRDGSSSSSWGHFSSGRGQKSFGWIFLISYNFSFENDPQNRAWLKNMILVRSVQRVFKPWQPPGRVLLSGKCYHHESHRKALQKITKQCFLETVTYF